MQTIISFLGLIVITIGVVSGEKKICKQNEYFTTCASSCVTEPSCEDRYPSTPSQCQDECIEKCVCLQNYIRSKHNGQCVKLEDCPGICGPNEVFNLCAPSCSDEPICLNRNPTTPYECVSICEQRCECKPHYIRARPEGECIKIKDCPEECGLDEQVGCKPCCDPHTCETRDTICDQTCACVLTCVCKDGYVLRQEDDKCIPVEDCLN